MSGILKNKKALITGATGAIGKTIANFFVREGCDLVLAARSKQELRKISDEFKKFEPDVYIYPTDVGDFKDVKNLAAFAEKKFGKLDILVTAAAIYGEIGSVERCDPEKWIDAIKVNLWGTMLAVKYAIPLLKKSGPASSQGGRGKIIAFAGGGEGPLPNFTSYLSSKSGVLRLVESLSEELKPYKIEINAISPGLVNSGFVQNLIKAGPKLAGKQKYKEALEQVSGKARTVSPLRAAALAAFLASEKSNGITGRMISAVHDKWQEFPKHIKEIIRSDIYTSRRIKPKDRGYDW